MPDGALESTERQFTELLQAAAGGVPVRLRLFALADVPRTEAGRQNLSRGYLGIGDLASSRLDGLIVTGTEPRAPALADEPYWRALTDVMQWAKEHTASTIWSCLAAHAAVLHLDGIRRNTLPEKRCGVFACDKAADHPLLEGLPERIPVAHSRFNDLDRETLTARGYTILTVSREAGVDTFVKHSGSSLFVFFQGHPEYDRRALLREYRRDVGRFLRRERESYPALPRTYFDPAAIGVLTSFHDIAQLERHEGMLNSFPMAFLEQRLQPMPRSPVARLYGNWLKLLRAQKARRQSLSPQAVRAGAGAPAHGVV
jgi:homoserine O-succinyltransferase